jgi:hypothetical protein
MDYTIPAGGTGTLSFDWNYHTTDVDGPTLDVFFVLNGGTPIQISDSGGADTQAGSEAFGVNEGDIVGFRLDCTDCVLGSATVTISNFAAPGAGGPIAVPVPALSWWALVALALGLAALAYTRRSSA